MDSYATNTLQESPTNLKKGFLTPTIAYILFGIIFFKGLVFMYFRRHSSSSDPQFDDHYKKNPIYLRKKSCAYILFDIIFFMGLVFMYFRRHCSSLDYESGDIHRQPASKSPTVVAETAGECTNMFRGEMTGEPSDCPVCRYSERSEEVELVTWVWYLNRSEGTPPRWILSLATSTGNRCRILRRRLKSALICFVEVGEGETVKIIVYCNHIFHANCIEKWLEYQVTTPCAGPVCRSRVPWNRYLCRSKGTPPRWILNLATSTGNRCRSLRW
ncbi:hypothetical protein PHAVU_008G180900 [Phaseolus vulgaris]|uniref:RING-type domain-containing protein n=1 Tax=Phaseolus vulgaris TaxID=3885 RepID=V7B5R6_PHAVU|nr:hypothetical protein PHAVU_008G180900g [Phaseolus vulgaris]ESW13252.1 hypothetical protein PHAVU_008G180900g [Phaseolus vulgaris]